MTVPLTTFLPDIAIEVPGCPQPLIEHHIVRVLADFCMQSRYLTEILPAKDVVANLNEYAVAPSSANNQLVRIEEVWYDGEAIDPVSVAELDAEITGWRTDTGLPRIYASEDGEGTLLLVPVPDADAAGALKIKISIALDPTTSPTGFDPILYRRYGQGIAAGVKAKLMAIPGQSWSNPDLASQYSREYQVTVSTAKEASRKGLTKSRRRAATYYR